MKGRRGRVCFGLDTVGKRERRGCSFGESIWNDGFVFYVERI